MPQMKPLNWLSLLLIFSFMYLLMLMIFHFSLLFHSNLINNSYHNKIKSFKNTW